MRGKRFVLGICGAVVCAPLLLAQQTPIYGCNGAVTCNRPLGYTALTGNPAVFFGVGARWSPGFQTGIVTPSTEVPRPETMAPDVRVFHLRSVSLLPPPSPPAPEPSPRPTPAAPARN